MENIYPAETASGTVTSFIPLTTTFTPSSACTSYFRLNGPSLVAFDPGYGLDIDSNVRCVPSAVTTWWEQGRFGFASDSDHTAVSIGPLTCPDEWTTVASSVNDRSTTQAMCCPAGYHLENGTPNSVGGDCISDVTSGMTLTFASTSAGNSESWSTATTTLTRDSSVGAIAVVGWNIPRTSSTSSAPTLSTANPSTSTTSTSLATPIQSATTPAESGGLSSGAAAGIGVGSGLAVIGFIALLTALWITKRRKKKAMNTTEEQGNGPSEFTPSYPQPYPPMDQVTTQQRIHELSPEGFKPELDGHHVDGSAIESQSLRYARQYPVELYGN